MNGVFGQNDVFFSPLFQDRRVILSCKSSCIESLFRSIRSVQKGGAFMCGMVLSAVGMISLRDQFVFRVHLLFSSNQQNNRTHNQILHQIRKPEYSQDVYSLNLYFHVQMEELVTEVDYLQKAKDLICSGWNVICYLADMILKCRNHFFSFIVTALVGQAIPNPLTRRLMTLFRTTRRRRRALVRRVKRRNPMNETRLQTEKCNI